MRKFIQRALNKIDKLDSEQVISLILDLAGEHEQLESVFDSLTDGIIVTDEEHRIIIVNKWAQRFLPLKTVDYLEEIVWDVVDDSDISSFLTYSLKNKETILDKEFTLDTWGQTRIFNISITPLVRKGAVQGNIILIQDVSEKRVKEARLRRAESLASLTTLTAGVAHEIKNPLGSIGIHIQLIERILRDKKKVESKDVQSYLSVVTEELDRLNRIVVDFLFAVRPMDIEPMETNLNALLEDLLSFMQYELDEAGIIANIDLDPELPKLELDEKFIKQAVLNIVKNAINAMPNGGKLIVSTEKKGSEAFLRISDTGMGMSKEVQEKIFEPYFTTKDFGSGIGLTLVYKIIKEHKGEISVVSQEGKGTSFSITLPIPQKEKHLLRWEPRNEV